VNSNSPGRVSIRYKRGKEKAAHGVQESKNVRIKCEVLRLLSTSRKYPES
jgi:hypothetical protein